MYGFSARPLNSGSPIKSNTVPRIRRVNSHVATKAADPSNAPRIIRLIGLTNLLGSSA